MLENGAIRLKFKLIYPAVEIDGVVIMQTSIFTMNAGNHAFHVSVSFKLDEDIAKAKAIRPVAGLTTRAKNGKPSLFTSHLITYADPVMAKEGNGIITTFLMSSKDNRSKYTKMMTKSRACRVVLVIS